RRSAAISAPGLPARRCSTRAMPSSHATAPSPARPRRTASASPRRSTCPVRAFNTLSYMLLEREANRAEPRLAIPIAGDDASAVQVAASLVRDAGFEPVVVGKLADARRFQRGTAGY